MSAVAVAVEALPSARELLPHAEAAARKWRNTKLGLVGIPLALLGAVGTSLMIAVGIAGESRGEELWLLLGLMAAVLLSGVATVAQSIWGYMHDPACEALRREEVVRVEYAYLSQLTGYEKMVTYTLRSGARYACIVPDRFGR